VTALRASLVLFAAFAAGACGHEDENLSGVRKVDPPGGAAVPAASRDDPHGGPRPPISAAPAKPSVTWSAPSGWKESRPSSTMRVAQFDVGVDAAGDPVQCIVFGGEMGDADQNIARWIGQMGPEAKAGANVTKTQQGRLAITRVAVTGTYTDTMRAEPKTIEDAAMLAAVVVSPADKLYVKFVGPKAQVDAAAKQFDEFLASMK
jgi:hypothetical protein